MSYCRQDFLGGRVGGTPSVYANGLAWGHTGTLRGDGGNGGGGVFFLSSGLAGADFWDQNADKKNFPSEELSRW